MEHWHRLFWLSKRLLSVFFVFFCFLADFPIQDDGTFSLAKFAENANKPSVRMIEIKLSQGAKPGKGGVLPGKKVFLLAFFFSHQYWCESQRCVL